MPDIRFRCPSCNGKLAVDPAGAGMRVKCPKCKEPLTIPHSSTLAPKSSETGLIPPPDKPYRKKEIATPSAQLVEIQAARDKALADVAALQAELGERESETRHQAEALKIQEATFDRVRQKLEEALQERAIGEAREKVERERVEQQLALVRDQQDQELGDKLAEERKRVTEELKSKEQQITSQQAALTGGRQRAERERDELRIELEKLKTEQRAAQDKAQADEDAWRQNIEASEKALAAAQERVVVLEQDVADHTERSAGLVEVASHRDELEQARARLEGELEKRTAEMVEEQANRTRLEQDLVGLRADLEAALQENKRVEEGLKQEFQAKVDVAHREAGDQIQALETQLDEARRTVQEKSEQAKAWVAEKKELVRIISEVRARVEQANEDLEARAKAYAEDKEQWEARERDLEKDKERLAENLSSKLDGMVGQLQAMEAREQELLSEKERLVTELGSQAQAAVTDRTDWNSREEMLKKSCEDLQGRLNEEVAGGRQALQEELRGVEARLASERDQYQAKEREAKLKLSQLESDLRSRTQDLEVQRAEKDRYETETAKLRQEVVSEQAKAKEVERKARHDVSCIQKTVAEREAELQRERDEKQKVIQDAKDEYERLTRAIQAKDEIAQFERETRMRLERQGVEKRLGEGDKPSPMKGARVASRTDKENATPVELAETNSPAAASLASTEEAEPAKKPESTTPEELAKTVDVAPPVAKASAQAAPPKPAATVTPKETQRATPASDAKVRPTGHVAARTATAGEWRPASTSPMDGHRATRPTQKPGKKRSWILIGGWIYLFLSVGFLAMSPALYLLYGALALAALALGVLLLRTRRSPLVYGLIVFSVVLPVAGFAGARFAGFQGLMPELKAKMTLERGSEQAADIHDRSGDPEEAPQTSGSSVQPESVTMTPGPGGSTTSGFVRVTFDDVRSGPITMEDVLGNRVMSDQDYLIVELTLANVSEDRVVTLQAPWRNTRLVDSVGANAMVVYEQRSGFDRIEGAVQTAELEPGASIRDRMVFELPENLSNNYVIISEPGFMSRGLDGERPMAPTKVVRLKFEGSDVREGGRKQALAESNM